MSRWLTALLLLAPLGGSRAECAKRQFGVQFSCPEERVEITPRDDIEWSAVVMSGGANETPPPEVAKQDRRLHLRRGRRRLGDAHGWLAPSRCVRGGDR